ncbi:MAG TPA: sugar ABC transporter substrate-binding protein [Actinomycetota bacterium]|nr:sugar ABC transporter substrate-binding protein [Actinomycetota bacterium]
MARTMKLVALVVATLTALAACGGEDSRAGSTKQVSFQIFGDAAEIKAYQSLIDAFQAKTPGVKVKLVPVPSQNDHSAKLSAGFAGGSPPDLFLINFRRFGQYAARGALEPVEPMLESSTTMTESDFYPQAIDAFRFGGTLTCMPQNISSQVVYYNKELFKRFNVAEPKAGWTWTDFLSTAKALTKDTDGDGTTDIYGLGVDPTLVFLGPWVWQAGAQVVDDTDNPSQTVMLDDKALEALKFFIELRRIHKVVPDHAEAESEGAEARFGNGRSAMLIDSRRGTTALRQQTGLDWDVVQMPKFREEATMLHSDAYCMSKASKSKDAAWKFVEFAFGEEGAAIIAKTGRTVPSLKKVAESPAFLDPTQKPANAHAWLDAIPTVRRLPNISTWNEIESKANVVIEEWFYGQERIEALGIEIDLATRELFAEAKAAPSPGSS